MPGTYRLYYGGTWHDPVEGEFRDTYNPATGEVLASVPHASAVDARAAIAAARKGFEDWRQVKPLERAKILRQIAAVLREHATEVAMLDSTNGGNPISEMLSDANVAANLFEFHAGLVTEMKGASIPM